jgi:hypothetical protein
MELENQFVNEQTNKTAAVVVKHVEPLLHRCHNLSMDSFYNSPDLARFLKSKGTNCIGTLLVHRKNVPPLVKTEKLKRGEHIG